MTGGRVAAAPGLIICVCVRLCVLSEPPEPIKHELTELEQDLEKQMVQLREWQMKELLKLRQKLHSLEREKKQAHQQEVTTLHITHL